MTQRLKITEKVSFYNMTNGQTVLPDRSILIGQKFVENAKIEKYKCDILKLRLHFEWTKVY